MIIDTSINLWVRKQIHMGTGNQDILTVYHVEPQYVKRNKNLYRNFMTSVIYLYASGCFSHVLSKATHWEQLCAETDAKIWMPSTKQDIKEIRKMLVPLFFGKYS